MECLAEYDYEAEQPDELSFKVNDIIKNVKKQPGDGWWEGEINGKRGVFPNNFVKERKIEKQIAQPPAVADRPKDKKGVNVAELANKIGPQGIKIGPPPTHQKGFRREGSKKRQKVRVTFDYKAENPDELTIKVNDVIDILKQEEEGWWEGELHGKRGMFPSNFCETIAEGLTSEDEKEDVHIDDPSDPKLRKKVIGVGLGNIFGDQGPKLKPSKRQPETSNVKVDKKIPSKRQPPIDQQHNVPTKEVLKDQAIVEHHYAATNEDELDLEINAVITVLDKNTEDDGWWKGELNGKIGMFPNNFVKLLPAGDISNNNNNQDKPKKPPPPSSNKVTVIKQGAPPNAVPRPASLYEGAKPITNKKPAQLANKSHSVEDRKQNELNSNSKQIADKLTPDTQKPITAGGDAQQALQTQLEELKAEFLNFRQTTVSKDKFDLVQKELESTRSELATLKSGFNKRFLDLMTEIDEEKKKHLSFAVEIDRIKKLVTS